jgi:hypothetical protein
MSRKEWKPWSLKSFQLETIEVRKKLWDHAGG